MFAYRFTLGIDWGNTEHALCLLDATTKKRFERTVPHSSDGTAALIAWVTKLVPDLAQVAAGIERADHDVVDALLEAGIDCYAINPKQAERFRSFLSVAKAKDDGRDARAHAHALQLAPEAFRKLEAPDKLTTALRELSRRHDTLNADHLRFSNRLYEQLQRFAPELLSICKGADQPFFWDLLAIGADPAAAAKLDLSAVAKVLKAHGKRKLTAPVALALLQRPRLPRAPGATDAILANIACLLPQLCLIHQLRAQARAEIERLTPTAGKDAEIIDSMIGVDLLTVAVFLAEAPQAIKQRDLQALRLQAGTAPVTRSSGNQRYVTIRHACNHRLRQACFTMALTASRIDPYAAELYRDMRARGLSPFRAWRGIADRLLTRLIACLEAGVVYSSIPPRTQVSAAAAP